MRRHPHSLALATVLTVMAALGPAQPSANAALSSSSAAARAVLPAEVEQALAAAQVPREALSLVLQEVDSTTPQLAWQAHQPVNPASLMKLLTTHAALELLGPAWTWTTPVWLDGPVQDGVLQGDLVIRGSGDPTLVLERVWLLLRRVQQLGVREVRGDIVLDRSAFAPPTQSPADFDGDSTRPYNVQPDALMLSHKSVLLNFVPDAASGTARVFGDPPLAGVQTDAQVPLSLGPCTSWRAGLRAELADPARLRFAGSYPLACGVQQWPLAYADPASFNARALEALWREMGGQLAGGVRDGVAPTERPPSFEFSSPPLADVVRDINKFSNNLMAQQLFLTLGLTQRGSGSPEAAREALHGWLDARFGDSAAGVVLDNGSGLSRDARLSARFLARLLQAAWASPVMPELVASLPVGGVDGTLRRARQRWSPTAVGRTHLKTGSLRDVAGIAGYVLTHEGRRCVLVAIIHHPNAGAARPALDALVQWALDGGSAH